MNYPTNVSTNDEETIIEREYRETDPNELNVDYGEVYSVDIKDPKKTFEKASKLAEEIYKYKKSPAEFIKKKNQELKQIENDYREYYNVLMPLNNELSQVTDKRIKHYNDLTNNKEELDPIYSHVKNELTNLENRLKNFKNQYNSAISNDIRNVMKMKINQLEYDIHLHQKILKKIKYIKIYNNLQKDADFVIDQINTIRKKVTNLTKEEIEQLEKIKKEIEESTKQVLEAPEKGKTKYWEGGKKKTIRRKNRKTRKVRK